MTKDDEGFVSRWSRRKQLVRSGDVVPAEPPRRVAAPPAVARVEPVSSPVVESPTQPPPPLPTHADVANLNRDSDYAQFMRPGVDGGVKSAAMKKLFADPHFNIMDGLDVYIDDYNKPDPMPASMLRQLVQAKALRLFDDEEDEERKGAEHAARPEAFPHGAPPAVAPPLSADENPDLQLQPDHAARREVAGGGADAGGERRDDVG